VPFWVLAISFRPVGDRSLDGVPRVDFYSCDQRMLLEFGMLAYLGPEYLRPYTGGESALFSIMKKQEIFLPATKGRLHEPSVGPPSWFSTTFWKIVRASAVVRPAQIACASPEFEVSGDTAGMLSW